MSRPSVFDRPATEVLRASGLAYKTASHGGATWLNFTGTCPLCSHDVKGDACGVSMRETFVGGERRYVHGVRCFHSHDSVLGESPKWGEFVKHIGALEVFPSSASGRKTAATSGGTSLPNIEFLQSMERHLRKTPAALAYLHQRGLTDSTIRRYQIGLRPAAKDQAGRDYLSAPVFDRAGHVVKPYVNYSIPGLTQGEDRKGWAVGSPVTYYADRVDGQTAIFVAEGMKDLWRLRQELEGTELAGRLLIVSSTHGTSQPDEWKTPAFWAQWETVYLGTDRDAAGEAMAAKIARAAQRDCLRVVVPEGLPLENGTAAKDWTDLFATGRSRNEFESLLTQATPMLLTSDRKAGADATPDLGRLEYSPVDLGASFSDGFLYYPVETMVRSRVTDDKGKEVVSEDIETVVVRSDRTIHHVRSSSRRTDKGDRKVFRLLPDTKLNAGEVERSTIALRRLPRVHAGQHAWTWPAITEWLAGRTTVRPLREILDDIEAHFRRVVWLPHEDDYTLLALLVPVTYTQPIFDAVPLVLVNGPHGSGKSTIGTELARLAFNGMTIGSGSAAAIARQIDETRGFVSLDDLESIGMRQGAKPDAQFGELLQTLKLSYMRETANKSWYNMKSGRSEMLNFYGVKVLTNTSGVDTILGSRMFRIYTRKLSSEEVQARSVARESNALTLRQLRDELYAWAFEHAAAVAAMYAEVAPSRTDRADEIASPLRTIARLAGDATREATLNRIVDRQRNDANDPDDPEELLHAAVRELVKQGHRYISPTHVALEMGRVFGPNYGKTFVNEIPEWQQPLWLGRKLRSHQLVDPFVEAERPRTEHGMQLRVYPISRRVVVEAIGEEAADQPPDQTLDARSFCRGCGQCPYANAGCQMMAGRMEWERKRGLDVARN